MELLLAVPLFALFAVVAFGMPRHAFLGPWMDERLESRLLCADDPACEEAVVSHRREMPHPAYLGPGEASFSRTDPPRRRAFTPIGRVMDGAMAIQAASFDCGPDPSLSGMARTAPSYAGTASRRLGWWRCSRIEERDLRDRVGRVLFAGKGIDGLITWIRRAGMDPVRVNADVLPSDIGPPSGSAGR